MGAVATHVEMVGRFCGSRVRVAYKELKDMDERQKGQTVKLQYLAVCTFELKNATQSDYETAYAALQVIGLRPDDAANIDCVSELPAISMVGTYWSTDIRFLRNCLNFKLQEVFARHGLEAEFLVVISRGDLAWVRGGFAAGDFAERHGTGVLALASGG